MTSHKRSSEFAIVSLFLSLLGLGLLPFLLLSPPPTIINIPWQNQLIGTAFAAICILGITAGTSPTHCSRSTRPKKQKITPHEESRKVEFLSNDIQKLGHHPTCEHYSGHVILFRKRIFCAGCTGLVTGAVLALAGTALFFFGNWRFIYPEAFFWTGLLFTAIGLLQHPLYRLFSIQQGEIRVITNVLFVVGSFLLLATLIQITDNLILGAYLLLLILFWIFTRIMMSRRSHRRICAQCNLLGCQFFEA